MSQPKRGDFVLDKFKVTLYICTGNKLGLIKCSGSNYVHSYICEVSLESSDKVASRLEVDTIMDGQLMPDWVNQILIDVNQQQLIYNPIAPATIKGLYATLNPGVQLPFPLPEAESVPKLDTNMSLKTFQNNCMHNWIEYRGFTREYKYCKHCDKKE